MFWWTGTLCQRVIHPHIKINEVITDRDSFPLCLNLILNTRVSQYEEAMGTEGMRGYRSLTPSSDTLKSVS
jgi:hypothetical protein